jgi:tetratricopeptide (TPR) repeat protein
MSGLSEKLLERALLSIRAKSFDLALSQLAEAIKYDPELYEAWILRGNVLAAQDKYFDAALHFKSALAINPDAVDALTNEANALAHLGMFKSAEEIFQRALLVRSSWEAHSGLADLYSSQMKLDKAEHHMRLALQHDNTADRHWNLGAVLLGQGKWEEGWREYAYRWKDNPLPPLAYRALPQWEGQPLDGKSIVLYPEQGYGDEILGLRWGAAGLFPNARRVYVQARVPMLELARSLNTHDFIPLHRPLPRADYGCALLDVPRILGTLSGIEVSSWPHAAYLQAPVRRIAMWKDRLPKGFNLGVCWMSGGHFSTTLAIQRAKSIPVDMLRAFKQPGVNLISLQKPIMEKVPPELELLDMMDEVDDFADTAALIEALDLVVTVDTAVAHVAGAIGKRVFNLVRFNGYWPWLSPEAAGDPYKAIWYSSMTLYRQPRIGDWQAPVERAALDLGNLRQLRTP